MASRTSRNPSSETERAERNQRDRERPNALHSRAGGGLAGTCPASGHKVDADIGLAGDDLYPGDARERSWLDRHSDRVLLRLLGRCERDYLPQQLRVTVGLTRVRL